MTNQEIVKWFSDKKGLGFIERDDGASIFVHQSEIQMEGFRKLVENERVEFITVPSEKGPRATAVKRIF